MEIEYAIVGLGNPGVEYEKSPHNVGFDVIYKLSSILKASNFRKYKDSLVSKNQIKGKSFILALPQTYMNNSGVAVKQLKEKFSFDDDRLIVVYDDLDLPIGSIKLKPKGGSGGHNGVESIIEHLQINIFKRVRVGIKCQEIPKENVIKYLLKPLSREKYLELQKGTEKATEALISIIHNGWERTISNFNKKERKEENG